MGDEDDMQKAQALVNQLQAMKDEAQSIAQKISELDQERHEHGEQREDDDGAKGRRLQGDAERWT